MSDEFTVIVSTPDADGAVAGALFGRATEGRAEALVFDSRNLPDFFRPAMQQKLPHGYDLVLCGPGVVRTDWDGRPVRPALMDALRAVRGPARWYSGRRWDPEDLRAVAHVIGEDALRVSGGNVPAAELIRRDMCPSSDPYAERLVRLVNGDLSDRERQEWGALTALVLTAAKAEPEQMAAVIALLMEERVEEVIARFGEAARRTDEDNCAEGRRQGANVRRVDGMKLVLVNLGPARQPFWSEVSGYARGEAKAELSLCTLEGRSVLLIGSDAAHVDLDPWVRYVTDMMPGTERTGEPAGTVAVCVPGLADDPGLCDDVIRLLEEGAHLLRR